MISIYEEIYINLQNGEERLMILVFWQKKLVRGNMAQCNGLGLRSDDIPFGNSIMNIKKVRIQRHVQTVNQGIFV